METKKSKAPSFALAQLAWDTREAQQERFWTHVDKSGECWLYEPIGPLGYARFSFHNKKIQAHVYAKIVSQGLPNPGAFCLHICVNTRNCVRPSHLRWGDHNENMADVVRQKRSNVARGEDAKQAILSQTEAIAIWIEYSKYHSSAVDIARRLGKSIALVRAVISETRWAHVTSVLAESMYPRPERIVNQPTGEDAPTSKLGVGRVKSIRVDYAQGMGIHAIATKQGESPGNISAVVKRDTWKEVDETCLIDGRTDSQRIIAADDMLSMVRKKMRTGKSFEGLAQKLGLSAEWLRAFARDGKTALDSRDIRYWMRAENELNEEELVTIWRLHAQAQKDVAWLSARFSVKQDAVLAVISGKVQPQLFRRLDMKASGGTPIVGRSGIDNAAAKLDADSVQTIRKRLAAGEKDAAIARDYKMSPAGIAMLRRGQTYKDVPWPENVDRAALNRVRTLSAEVVVDIYRHAVNATDTVENLAAAYGTNVLTVRKIREGKSYAHFTQHLRSPG
jgi:hypothetical protein